LGCWGFKQITYGEKTINIVAVIPARSGSKGVPDKNIAKLLDKPLIAYSIEAARRTSLISRVIVSTDSDKYASIAKSYGAEIPFLRPNELSKDDSTDYDFVKHLLDWFSSNENNQPEYIIHLRPTTPIRDPEIIDDAIKLFMKNNDATSLRSGHEMSETAYKQFEIEGGYFKKICTGSFNLDDANENRQSFPKTYFPNGYVDILKTSFVLKNELLHGNKVLSYITDFAIEIDTIEDFEFLEWQMNKDNKIINKLFKG